LIPTCYEWLVASEYTTTYKNNDAVDVINMYNVPNLFAKKKQNVNRQVGIDEE